VPEFLPGLELSRAFYSEVVAPILGDTPHSAARLGWGSDVLGFDTERSTDHGWGPQLQVFVEETFDIDSRLPQTFRGWPVRYGWDDKAVEHHVDVTQLGNWLQGHLGFDPRPGMETRDWLTTPQQLLLGVTAGAVFHDGLGELQPLRAELEWYPHDVWLWLIACQWGRIDQEEPFVGRTAEVGDELGSSILTARLARDLMRLCFLLERRYAPYSKWFGTAFAQLEAAVEVGQALERAAAATDFPTREEGLTAAVEAVARRHNALAITEHVDPTVRPFYTRPFQVLGSRRFVDACLAEVEDEWLRSLPLTGAIDQWSDSTDVLSDPPLTRRLGSRLEP
jgi:uncharacterized protein DUF4037